MRASLLEIARAYRAAGLSVIPIRPVRPGGKDKGKQPTLKTWKGYQEQLPEDSELVNWFGTNDEQGIAIICGLVSLGLEVLDFDTPWVYEEWCSQVEEQLPGLLATLPQVRSPSGGAHVYCHVETPAPNTALARQADGKHCHAETRGEGGYVLAPGSRPCAHPTGGLYLPIEGTPRLTTWAGEILPESTRETLWALARGFNEWVEPEPTERQTGPEVVSGSGKRPGDQFNTSATWEGILTPAGWVPVRQTGEVIYWRRPGKEGHCWSATTGRCKGHDGRDLFYCFTSSGGVFEQGKTYSRFGAYALLNSGGDYRKAAQTLADKGYGEPRKGDSGHGRGHTRRTTHAPLETQEQQGTGESAGNENSTQEGLELDTTCLLLVKPQPVDWLIPDLLPLGKLFVLAGDGGLGKSSATLHIAADLSRGRCCCGLSYDNPARAQTLLISCEDDVADTIVPRLLAHDADLSLINKLNGITKHYPPAHGEAGKHERFPFSLADVGVLGDWLTQNPACRLVVIDPATAFVGAAGVDDHRDSELRALLGPLHDLAGQHKVSIVLIMHCNKGSAQKACNRVLGGVGYVNASRAAFLVCQDPEDKTRRLMLPLKYNLTGETRGLAYRTERLTPEQAIAVLAPFNHLDDNARERLASQLFTLHWEGRVDITAEEALTPRATPEGPRQLSAAAQWLEAYLGGQPRLAREVHAAGQLAGYTEDQRRRAGRELGIRTVRESGRPNGPWYWIPAGVRASWEPPVVLGVVGVVGAVGVDTPDTQTTDPTYPDAVVGCSGIGVDGADTPHTPTGQRTPTTTRTLDPDDELFGPDAP